MVPRPAGREQAPPFAGGLSQCDCQALTTSPRSSEREPPARHRRRLLSPGARGERRRYRSVGVNKTCREKIKQHAQTTQHENVYEVGGPGYGGVACVGECWGGGEVLVMVVVIYLEKCGECMYLRIGYLPFGTCVRYCICTVHVHTSVTSLDLPQPQRQ